jgi:hypothetical protein
VQTGGPPILLGAWSKFVPKRVVEYCDGWFPVDVGVDLASGIEAISIRSCATWDAYGSTRLQCTYAEEMAPRGIEGRIGELLKFGFKRILFLISPDQPDKQRTVSDRYATLIGKFA